MSMDTGDLVVCLAAADWPVFGATLLAAIGEFAIVWAILSEVRGTRESNFLQTVFGEHFYTVRSALYTAFLNDEPKLGQQPDRKELWKKSLAFAKLASRELAVRKNCDSQITHLNQVALLYGKRRILSRMLYRNDELIEWFPHAVILCWIMLGPYILERKKLVGHFWAAALVGYALACVDYVLKDKNAQLAIFSHTPGAVPATISRKVLQSVQDELRDVADARSRDEVERVLKGLNDNYVG